VKTTTIGESETLVKRQKELSTREADELSKVLNSMKLLASDINVEQDAQLKQIDHLTESVDRANSRLRTTTRRIDDATK